MVMIFLKIFHPNERCSVRVAGRGEVGKVKLFLTLFDVSNLRFSLPLQQQAGTSPTGLLDLHKVPLVFFFFGGGEDGRKCLFCHIDDIIPRVSSALLMAISGASNFTTLQMMLPSALLLMGFLFVSA